MSPPNITSVRIPSTCHVLQIESFLSAKMLLLIPFQISKIPTPFQRPSQPTLLLFTKASLVLSPKPMTAYANPGALPNYFTTPSEIADCIIFKICDYISRSTTTEKSMRVSENCADQRLSTTSKMSQFAIQFPPLNELQPNRPTPKS